MDHVVKVDEMKRERETDRQSVEVENREQMRNCGEYNYYRLNYTGGPSFGHGPPLE